MEKSEPSSQPEPVPPPSYEPSPPPNAAAQPAPTTQQVIIQPANVVVLSDLPVTLVCPKCQAQVVTNVNYVNGTLTWILVVVLLIIFWPLVCVPCLVDGCKDAEHYCPNCNNYIGTKKRID